MELSLKIDKLSKKYDNFTLDNVTFSIPKGCIMGLIGENGAGKTTIINLILNLIKKDGGSIEVFGLDNIENEKEIKKRIGAVLDDSYFYDSLNPYDIAKIMKNAVKTWDDALFDEYLKKFNLPKNKIIKDYSKGMKAKLSIATALSHKPDLLILDEATSGLDPVIRSEILDEFLEFIQDEQHSILLSSHITSDLEKISDYITFIHEGKIIFSESKDILLYDYGVLKCKISDFNKIESKDIVKYRKNDFNYEILIKDKKTMKDKYSNYIIDSINLEEIMLLYIKGAKK